MKRICLFNLEQVAAVAESSSGVVYFNRAGEWADQELLEQEGFLVPLSNDAPDGFPTLLERLRDLSGGALPKLEEVDSLLQEVSCSDQLVVDRSRWSESRPGWIYVTVFAQGEFSQFDGFDRVAAVLTWPLN